jgi:hypothetical protein
LPSAFVLALSRLAIKRLQRTAVPASKSRERQPLIRSAVGKTARLL